MLHKGKKHFHNRNKNLFPPRRKRKKGKPMSLRMQKITSFRQVLFKIVD